MDSIAQASVSDAPSLAASPSPRIVERLFLFGLRRLRHGCLRITFPSGATAVVGDGQSPSADLRICGPIFSSKFSSGAVGFGESYVEGDWETDDLTGLLDSRDKPARDRCVAARLVVGRVL